MGASLDGSVVGCERVLDVSVVGWERCWMSVGWWSGGETIIEWWFDGELNQNKDRKMLSEITAL